MFYYVIVTSYVDWFSWFWNQWKEKTLPYTMVPNNYTFGGLNFKFTGGGNHPPQEDALQKTNKQTKKHRKTRVKQRFNIEIPFDAYSWSTSSHSNSDGRKYRYVSYKYHRINGANQGQGWIQASICRGNCTRHVQLVIRSCSVDSWGENVVVWSSKILAFNWDRTDVWTCTVCSQHY